MSQSSDSSRSHKRRPPPHRLGWPAAAANAAPVRSPEANHRIQPHARRVTFTGQKQVVPSSDQLLWTKNHAPLSSLQLCVAPKKVKEVTAWLKQPTAGKLLILVGSPGIGKSAMVHCLAEELGMEVREWTESYVDQASTATIEQLTPINSLEKFLQQTGVGYRALTVDVASSAPRKKCHKSNGSLILLDELPYLHDADAEARFRTILTAHVCRTTVSTILIYSNVAEGKAQSDDLERLVDAAVLYSPACQIIRINAPTMAKFQKIVKEIASREGARISPNYAEELYFRSGGDLRFAITTMQFELKRTQPRNGTSALLAQSQPDDSTVALRDTAIMPFHALGKLLYAKRQKGVHVEGQRPPLEFVPERVVEQSGMEIANILRFLEYHCVEFFTDMDELVVALRFFSDGAVLLDHPTHEASHSSSVFPTSYAISLAGRSVASANQHAAASSFRSFGAPKVYDVMRKRRENSARIHHICSSRNFTQSTTSAATFALDILPFARTILPSHHISTSFLDSYFVAPAASQGDLEIESALAKQEQDEILRLDDIVEDNEDGW